MTLTNYWLLLIWLVAGGLFFTILFPKQPVSVLGKTEYRWSMPAAIGLAAPYVIWAINRKWFGDTEAYRKGFLNISTEMGLWEYVATQTKDKGFAALSYVIKLLIGNQDKLFFLLIAGFQMWCIVAFYRKFSAHFLFCIFAFVASTDYLSWMFNGLRQFIAACIVLYCFELVLKQKYVPAVALVLLAATIHGTALIVLPVLFAIRGRAWNKRTVFIAATLTIAVLFVDQFTDILDTMLAETQYEGMLQDEIWTVDDGTNIMRVLAYSAPAILSFIGRRHIHRANNPVINLCVNCSIITAFIYLLSSVTSGIYVGRLPIYTTLPGYMVIPWLIEEMFTERSAQILKAGVVMLYVAFFYFQMHFGWGLI